MIEIKNSVSDASVSVLNIKYEPRRLEVKSRSNFSTPVRSITDRDYENNRVSTSKLKLPDSVSNLTVYYGLEQLSSLLKINGYLRELKERVSRFMRSALNSPIRILALRIEPGEAYQVLSLKENVERLIRFISYVQEPLGTVSLPYFVTESVEVDVLYKEFTKAYDNPVIWLRMDEEEKAFAKRVDCITELIREGRLNLVGIHYSDYVSTSVNYDYLYQNIHNLDVLTLLEGVDRKDLDTNLSNVHIYPFASFDAVAPRKKPPIPGGNNRFGIKKPTGNFFIRKDVTLRHLKEITDMNSVFDNYKGSPIYELVNEIHNLDPKKKIDVKDPATRRKLQQFNAFSYVHQAMEGSLEMQKISDSINKKETMTYLTSKETLDEKVKQTFPKK
jgi:hypothetical protein